MEKRIIATAGALVVVPVSIWFYTSDHQLKYDLAEAATTLRSAVENSFPSPQPKCDSAEAVATIKRMALEKINDKYRGDELISFYSRKYLGKNPVAGVPPNMGDPFSIEEVTMEFVQKPRHHRHRITLCGSNRCRGLGEKGTE